MTRPVLDLRTISAQGIADNPNPGPGIFEQDGVLLLDNWEWDSVKGYWHAPASADNAIILGSDPNATLRVDRRNALADRVGIQRSALPSSSLSHILLHFLLGSLASSIGLNPVLMRPDGVNLILGSFGNVIEEGFSLDHPNYLAAQNVYKQSVQRLVNSGEDISVVERYIGHTMLKFHGQRSDSLLSLYVPQSLLDAGVTHRKPSTTVADTFVECCDTNLVSHTPTGPNAGTGWALVEGSSGDLVVRAAQDDLNYAVSSGRVSARMTDALSGDDHYAQASCSNNVNGNGPARHVSVAARMSSSAATYYMGSLHRASYTADPYTIVKIVSGAYTELGSVSGTGDSATNNTLKLEVNGSGLDLYGNDGTELKVSVTDTSITGNLYAGISGRHTGSNRNQWDNFEAADFPLSMATDTHHPRLTNSPLIVGRFPHVGSEIGIN